MDTSYGSFNLEYNGTVYGQSLVIQFKLKYFTMLF